MAEKKDNLMGLGEISTIRNILMGDLISQYDQSFENFEKKIDKERKETVQVLEALETRMNERLTKLESAVDARFEKMEQMISSQLASLEEKLLQSDWADRNQLAELLTEVSRKLVSK